MLLTTLSGLTLEGANFTQAKPLLLLAYLALEGPKERRHLAELFWQDAADALNSLSKALYRLRQAAPGVIEADNARVWAEVQTDALMMLAALEHDELEKGITLYGGAFLEGLMLPDWGAEVEEWVYSTREFLARRVQEAHLQLGERQAAEGMFKEAARHAEAALKLPGAAGLEPEMLERAYLLLVAGESALAPEVRREAEGFGIALRLSGAEARQRLKSEDISATYNPLPSRGTSFIGRTTDLDRIWQLLAQEECRLVTLAGAGGAGKTRLALEAAHRLQASGRFKDGVFFVPLESLASAEGVPVSIAGALGLQLQGTVDPLWQINNYLRSKHALIILDNFEHLLNATSIVSELLATSPQLKALITSRERLNLVEEWVLPVGGLALPPEDIQDSTEALKSEAIQLFMQRAKQANLDFVLTEENLRSVISICHFVDGSPLGIELAAVWVRLMPPADIAAEIEKSLDFLQASSRNVTDRHRSIRATFEYSWTLLTSREQEALSKFSIFRGGFTREAASEVAGASISLLASLLDKSLLRISSTGRYDRHPLLLQYTKEHLQARDDAEQVRQRHAMYFLKLVKQGSEGLKYHDQLFWHRWFDEELDNVRAALEWSLSSTGSDIGPQLTAAMVWYWRTHGFHPEAQLWLEQALSLAQDISSVRVELLTGLGLCRVASGNTPLAAQPLEEAIEMCKHLNDKALTASVMHASTQPLRARGDYDAAKGRCLTALAIRQELGDTFGTVMAYGSLADILSLQGDYESAGTYYERCVAFMREKGDLQQVSTGLDGWAMVSYHLGRLQEAAAMAEEGLSLATQVGDSFHVGLHLHNLGLIYRAQGDFTHARKYMSKSLNHLYENSFFGALPLTFDGLAMLANGEGDYQRAAMLFLVSDGLREKLGVRGPWVWEYQERQDALSQLVQEDLEVFRAKAQKMPLVEAVAFALD